METIQQLNEAIASERQQFQDYKSAKEGEINELKLQNADKDNAIKDLQDQLAAAQNNPNLPDGTIASIGTIVEP